MGTIHSTKISGLSFENFLDANGWQRVRSRSIPLLKRVLRSFKLSNVGLLLLHRYVPVEFKDFQTPLSNNEKKKIETLLGNKKWSNGTVNFDRIGPTE